MKKKLMITIGAIVGVVLLGFGLYQTNASQAAPKLTTSDIEQMVKDQYPGTITEIELEKKFNNYVYEVEIKGDGKEYELKLDADTGEILKLEEKFIEKEQLVLEDDNNQNDRQQEGNKGDKNDNTEQQKQNKSTTPKNNEKKTTINPKEAIDIALSEFSGTVKELEFEKDDGRLIYEIEVIAGYEEAEFKIDASTGEIVKNKRKKTSENFDKQTVINAKEAIDIALNKFSGTIKELELDEDDGRLIYEVEIKSSHEKAEVEIDAYTGEVLVIEIDTD